MHCGQHGKCVHQNGSEFTYRTEEEFPLKICENGQRKLYKTYMKVLTMAVAIVKCEIVILKQFLNVFYLYSKLGSILFMFLVHLLWHLVHIYIYILVVLEP